MQLLQCSFERDLVKIIPNTFSPFSFTWKIQLMCNHSENAMIYVLNATNGRTDLNINQFASAPEKKTAYTNCAVPKSGSLFTIFETIDFPPRAVHEGHTLRISAYCRHSRQ